MRECISCGYPTSQLLACPNCNSYPGPFNKATHRWEIVETDELISWTQVKI